MRTDGIEPGCRLLETIFPDAASGPPSGMPHSAETFDFVSRHVERCAPCRERFEPDLALWRALAEIPSPVAPSFLRLRPRHSLTRVAAAAAILLLAFGAFLVTRNGETTPSTTEAPVKLPSAGDGSQAGPPAAFPRDIVFVQTVTRVRLEGRKQGLQRVTRRSRPQLFAAQRSE
jgi:hypothetical protein